MVVMPVRTETRAEEVCRENHESVVFKTSACRSWHLVSLNLLGAG
jgi:hypothetical protein